MGEKIYKVMGRSGKASLALGIILIVVGIVSGILLIINGAKLLKNKNEIIF